MTSSSRPFRVSLVAMLVIVGAFVASIPVSSQVVPAASTAPTPAPQPTPVETAPTAPTAGPTGTPTPDPQEGVTQPDPTKAPAPAATPTLTPLPAWMTLDVFYRGRVEASRSMATRGSDNDSYYLNRLRVRATFTPTPYLELLGEGQDSRIAGYDGVGVPRTMRNVFDLRQAYVDLHAKGGKAWRVRVGRQELGFGDLRLMASPDWGNTNRTFDVVRTSAAKGRARVDVFGGYVVQLEPYEFDRRMKGEFLYGAWGVIDKVAPQTAIEPFVIVKHNDDVTGEDAVRGEADVVTVGLRATSTLLHRVDSATDIVVQRGAFANDDIRGWAFHQMLALPFATQPWKPRVVLDYATASGDNDPTDGRRQTFDQLYSSNHNRYGLADQIGWRNMHDVGLMFEATPHKALKVTVGAHQFMLRTVNDGFYAVNGTRTILNRKATSRHVGVELDGWFQWTVSKVLSLSGGLGTLVPGPYLDESTDGRTLWAPYLLWNVKF